MTVTELTCVFLQAYPNTSVLQFLSFSFLIGEFFIILTIFISFFFNS